MEKLLRVVFSGFTMVSSSGGDGEEEDDDGNGIGPLLLAGGRRGQCLEKANGGK